MSFIHKALSRLLLLKRLTASPAISLSTVSYIYWDNYVYYTDYLQAIHYFALHVPELIPVLVAG